MSVFVYSWCAERAGYVYDDAGITLRYAERIARGAGFGYNAGEAVNGASNPLFVLLEAVALRCGASPSSVVLGIGSLGLGLSAGVLFSTFARFYSIGAALFALLALLSFRAPFESVADGMETPLVGLLVVLLFRALHAEREWLPGLALGALVANKLDGALAALAFTAVHLVLRRSFPWRAALAAWLVAAPVFVLLIVEFGSIFPNSMLVKLSENPPGLGVTSPLWMQRQLTRGGFAFLYWAAWGSLAVHFLALRAATTLAIAALQAWFVLHMATYAAVSLGDEYPWYAAAPTHLCVILSTVLAHSIAEHAAQSNAWERFVPDAARRRRIVAIAMAAALAILVAQRAPVLVARLSANESGARVSDSTALDLARQAAGVWLRAHSSGAELLSTYEGLPAFEYGGPCYDRALLNSTRDDARERGAPYALTGPKHLADGAALPSDDGAGRRLVASFRFSASSGFHLLFARTDSEAWRSGARHLTFTRPVPQLFGEHDHLLGDAEGVHGAWRIPPRASARFEVDSPGPPSLLFLAAAVPDDARTTSASGSLRMTVRSADVELFSADLRSAGPPARVHVEAPASSGVGAYRFAIGCSAPEGAGAGELRLEIRHVLLRYGSPVRSTDFKLLFPRVGEIVDYVADSGLR